MSKPTASYAKLLAKARELNCGALKRHCFLCVPSKTDGDCCASGPQAEESWAYLKKRLKELNLEGHTGRSRADCLRLCQMGPIMVVYPEGVWYHSMSPNNLEKVIQDHILGNKVVKSLTFAPAT